MYWINYNFKSVMNFDETIEKVVFEKGDTVVVIGKLTTLKKIMPDNSFQAESKILPYYGRYRLVVCIPDAFYRLAWLEWAKLVSVHDLTDGEREQVIADRSRVRDRERKQNNDYWAYIKNIA